MQNKGKKNKSKSQRKILEKYILISIYDFENEDLMDEDEYQITRENDLIYNKIFI
jgi:hypothetical protein